MNTKQHNRKRRATILLLVVSILALLFVIVTGFLSVARNTRQLVVEAERGDTINRIVDSVKDAVLTELGNQIVGEPETGTVGSEYEMIPGYRGAGRLLSPVIPVWNEGFDSPATPRDDWRNRVGGAVDDAEPLERVVWPTVTNIDGGRDARPSPVGVLDLIPEKSDDGDDELDAADLERYSRQPRFDADGDGTPDSDPLRVGSIIENANLIAGLPVRVRNVLRNYFPFAGSGLSPVSFLRLGDPSADTPEQSQVRTALAEYNENSRYEVVIRTVPHGGMLALDAPPLFDGTNRRAPWNRDFVTTTFDNLRSLGASTVSTNPPTDLFSSYPVDRASADQVNRNSIFSEIAKAAPLVERQLRRRGGWLPAYPGVETGTRQYDASGEPIPPILSFLQGTLRTAVPNFPDNTEEDGFQAMFLPDFRDRQRAHKRDMFQRFNLGELVASNEPLRAENERYAFITAATLPPAAVVDEGSTIAGISSDDWRSAFARRALLTTVSFSDDRPRRMDPALSTPPGGDPTIRFPNPDPLGQLAASEVPGANGQYVFKFSLLDAARKYWLGDLFKTFDQTAGVYPQTIEFIGNLSSATGNYLFNAWQLYNGGRLKSGARVIETLASLYYDMLGSHSDEFIDTNNNLRPERILRDDWTEATDSPRNARAQDKQAVSRRQQALMLAVNTLAFAMPRSTDPQTRLGQNDPRSYFGGIGFIDVVSYTDWLPPTNGQPMTAANYKYDEYVGYSPQPVFTEAIVYGEVDQPADPADPIPPAEISIAVELYNPNDPYYVSGTDLHALYLDDFAISLNGANPNTPSNFALPPNSESPAILQDRGFGDANWRSLRPQNLENAGGALIPNASLASIPGRSFRTFELQIMTREGNRLRATENKFFSQSATQNGIVQPIELMYASTKNRTAADPTPPNPPSTLDLPETLATTDNVGAGEEWYDTNSNRGDSINLMPSSEVVAIDLWRKGTSLRPGGTFGSRQIVWYHIDRILVHYEKDAHRNFWTSTARDQSPSRHFGAPGRVAPPTPNNPPNDYARWRCMTDRVVVTHAISVSAEPLFASRTLNTGGWVRPSAGGGTVEADALTPSTDEVFSPETPFPCMNSSHVGVLSNTQPNVIRVSDRLTNLPMFGNPSDLRPRSYPTVGFLSYIPRFSHLRRVDTAGGASDNTPYSERREVRVPMSMTLAQQWRNLHSNTTEANELATGSANYAVDFGHMPMFDNTQRIPSEIANIDVNGDGISDPGVKRYVDEVGKIPWGQLIFDYFTTISPNLTDPDRIPGRIDINSAPWMMLAQLPMLGPVKADGQAPDTATESNGAQLPLRAEYDRNNNGRIDNGELFPPLFAGDPSPAFWAPGLGSAAGTAESPFALPANVSPQDEAKNLRRTLAFDTLLADEGDANRLGPRPDYLTNGQIRYRLNAPIAASAAAYRDGIQYFAASNGAQAPYVDSHLRNGQVAANTSELGAEFLVGNNAQAVQHRYRDETIYGPIRGQTPKTLNNSTIDPAIRRRPTEFGFVSVGELLNVKGFDASRSVNLPAGALPGSYSSLARGDFMKSVSLISMLDSNAVTTRSNTFTVYISIMDREDPSQSVRTQMTIDRSNLIKQIGRSSPRGLMPEIISETRVGYFNTRYDQ